MEKSYRNLGVYTRNMVSFLSVQYKSERYYDLQQLHCEKSWANYDS